MAVSEVRANASRLLDAIGIRRIVVVDDEYAREGASVEVLLGICVELAPGQASLLPGLGEVPFGNDYEVWSGMLREKWTSMEPRAQVEALRGARALADVAGGALTDFEIREEDNIGNEARKPAKNLVENAAQDSVDGPGEVTDPAMNDLVPASSPQEESVDRFLDEPRTAEEEILKSDSGGDARAAIGLQELLADLPDCPLVTLSLGEWKRSQERYLGDSAASQETLFLFDRDFCRENASPDEGLELVRKAQASGVAICGLVTHTVTLGGEQEAWDQLARDHDLDRDRFLVIAKQRLSMDGGEEHYSFLRMVRLVALSSRVASVKEAAWKIFEDSLTVAQEAMERVSVLDFDQIVLASSRREGVWEPETLFRVFSVFMRREARRRLHEDSNANIPAKILEARKVSSIPIEVETAIGAEPPCIEAIRVQRFELFESCELLNGHALPVDLGDIFEDGKGRLFILLSQPCDLMVRPNGRRAYDSRCTRQVTLSELRIDVDPRDVKASWAEISWYDEVTGAPAYVDFSRSHVVRLAVLDLCVLNTDGTASIDVQSECPIRLIEPWQKHYPRLKNLFNSALSRYRELETKSVTDEQKRLMLPVASLSAKFKVSVDGNFVKYDVRRVRRLNQPRAGALLTRIAQFSSRAAFEHDLDHRSPSTGDNDEEPVCQVNDAEADDNAEN